MDRANGLVGLVVDDQRDIDRDPILVRCEVRASSLNRILLDVKLIYQVSAGCVPELIRHTYSVLIAGGLWAGRARAGRLALPTRCSGRFARCQARSGMSHP